MRWPPLLAPIIVVVALVAAIGAALWVALGASEAAPDVPRELVTRSNLSAQERRGAVVYAANCYSCHGGPIGGELVRGAPVHTNAGHTWHHGDCQITAYIREGGVDMPGATVRMPAFAALSAAQVDAVLAYIKTMWGPEQRELQAETTRLACG